MSTQVDYLNAAVDRLQRRSTELQQQNAQLQKKLDDTDKALRMVWSGLELGVKDGPKGNPCDLFLALLEMHGLKRTQQ